MGWTTAVQFPKGAMISLRHHAQTGSGAHSASCAMGIGSSYPGGRATWAWSGQFKSFLCRG